jgi:paraquat-inducible protein B
MRMGAVREVKVTFDSATSSFVIPVVIELDPAPFITGEPNEAAATPVHHAIAAMVRVGLRAELAAANLVPGTLAVALEIRPEAAPPSCARRMAGHQKSRAWTRHSNRLQPSWSAWPLASPHCPWKRRSPNWMN